MTHDTVAILPFHHSHNAPPRLFHIFLSLSSIFSITFAKLPNPRIVEQPKDNYVARNEPATLNCKADGVPDPTITWFRNGRPVVTTLVDPTSHRMLLPNGHLFFLRIIHTRNNKPDVGVYHCRATNIHGIAESNNATLTIAVLREEFRTIPIDTSVAVGQEAVLKCVPPRGDPNPRIYWKKDGERVVLSDRVFIENGGYLVFKDVRKSDTGQYKCIASNKAGERISPTANLKVSEPPLFKTIPTDEKVPEGKDAVFKCKATGDPEPKIIWRKNQGTLPKGRTKFPSDHSLKIVNAQVEDEGVYVCQASNDIGSVEAVGHLHVEAPPKFVIKPTDKRVAIGRTVNLQCQVSGNPTPKIYWSKGSAQSHLMFSNQQYGRMNVAEDGTFTIKKIRQEDAGTYTCRARNDAGTAVKQIQIEVTEHDLRPPPIIHLGPQNQTLALKSIAMLPCMSASKPVPIIRWHHNGHTISFINQVRMTVLDSGTLQISDLHLSDSGRYTCKIMSETGETTWEAYLAVEPVNKKGVSFHRNPEPKSLPGPPAKLEIDTITDHSLRLSWRKPKRHGDSKIVGYQIEYFTPHSNMGWQRTILDKPQESYVIYNLQSSTSYIFYVRAINSDGVGQPSTLSDTAITSVERRQGSIPISVRKSKLENGIVVQLTSPTIINSTQVKVRWRVIKAHDVIEGYEIRSTYVVDPLKPEYGQSVESQIYSPTADSYVIRDLKKFAWYEVMVRAFAGSVKSSFSEPVRIKTKEDFPSAPPLNVVVDKKEDHSLSIRWNRPPRSDWNGLLRGYYIFLLGNESKFDRNLTRNSTTFGVVIRGIHPDVKYNVQVAAYNAVGMGNLSKPVSIDPERVSVMREPWFIGMLIGSIGGTLWLALCFFTLWMCRRHRRKKKMTKNPIIIGPFHKSEDVVRQENLVVNGKQHCPGILNGQPDILEPNQNKQYTQLPETIYHSTYGGAPVTHMTTFYNQSQHSVTPYASTTLINGTLVTKPAGLDHSFKPINHGYLPHGSGSSDSCIKRDFGSSGSDNSRPNTELITETHDGIHSPAGDSSGYTTDENGMPIRRHRKHPTVMSQQLKGHVNWAELLPPPPEHPPPSDHDSPTSRLSPALQCVLIDPSKHLNNPPHNHHTAPHNHQTAPHNHHNHHTPPHNHNTLTRHMDDQTRYINNPDHVINYDDPNIIRYLNNINNINDPVLRNNPHLQTDPGGGSGSIHAHRHLPNLPHPHLNNTPNGSAPDWAYIPPASRNISFSDSERANSPYQPKPDYLPRMVHDRTLPGRRFVEPYPQTVELPRNLPFIYGGSPQDLPFMRQSFAPQRFAQPRMGTHECEFPIRNDGSMYVPCYGPDDGGMLMERGCQSTLPRSLEAYTPNIIANGDLTSEVDDVPDYAGESDIEPRNRQNECTTPESSVGGDNNDAASVTASMLASWASVADSNTSCSSVRSSAASTSDGTFDAEADFATAVAKAAELSGMTVNGTTVTDSKAAKREHNHHNRKHRSQTHRPSSPYSTDSSVANHKPYPKAHRKKPGQPGRKSAASKTLANGSIAEITPLMAVKNISQDPSCVDEI